MKTLALLTTLCLLIAACSNAEIGNIKDVNPATVYTRYYVYCDDGADSTVTFKAQFTFAGPNGTSLVLNAPAKVTLDGESITVDSTGGEGAFYQVKKPTHAFTGEHTVTFTNIDGKEYINHFNFEYFNLQPMPGNVVNGGLSLSFSGLKNYDSVYIEIKDTSDETPNIDTMLAVNGNTLHLPTSLFSGLRNGPLSIQASKSYNRPLEHVTAEGGDMLFIYALDERTLLKK